MSVGASNAGHIRGAVILVVGLSILPLMDASAKHLAALGFAPILIAWSRFAVSTAMLSPIMLQRHRRDAFRNTIRPQALRAVMLTGATVLFYAALKTMPLADALAVYFIYPLLMTIMAPMVLGETVGWRRYVAVVVGFMGCLIVIRPGFAEIPIGVYYALGGGVFYALFTLLTRKLSADSDPWTTVFAQSLVGAVLLSAFVPTYWETPDAEALLFVLLLNVAAITAHGLIVKAYAHAPASFLAPLGYSEIVAATFIGWMWFGDLPDFVTFVGIAVIVSSGVYITTRDKRHQPPTPQP